MSGPASVAEKKLELIERSIKSMAKAEAAMSGPREEKFTSSTHAQHVQRGGERPAPADRSGVAAGLLVGLPCGADRFSTPVQRGARMPGECKGDFAIQILAFLERHYAPALVEQIWSEAGLPPKPIKDEFYSVGAINRCFGECVERGGKGMTLDELNYRSGEEGWLAFANSMVGRIGIALFARRPKRLASRAPNYHTTNNDFGSCRFVDTGPDSYRLEYRDMLSSPYYYHGLYDAATRQLSRGKVSLRVLKFEQAPDYAILADFDIAVEMPKT